MKSVAAWCALSALVGGCALAPDIDPSRAAVVRGPLPSRVQHPLALTMPSLGLRRALPVGRGSFALEQDLAYTTIFENDSDGADAVRVDGEFARASLRVTAGLATHVDLTLHTALIHGGAGSLDHFVTEWHEAFGFPNSGRDAVDEDRFEVEIVGRDESAYRFEGNRVAAQDVALELLVAAPRPLLGWTTGARAVLEFPVGDEGRGYGNGELDLGLGWSGERTSARWTQFAALGWVHPATPTSFDDTGVALSDVVQLGWGVELRWSESSSLVVQLDGRSGLSDDLDMEELSGPMVDLGLGVIRDAGQSGRVFFAFHEDVVSQAGPDFTLFAGWTWSP
ncbi:MAG: DUF3187 family protein [Planctomycetes bacterium]|nr:DUF3187 family protein [Planctomycetota bacterium]